MQAGLCRMRTESLVAPSTPAGKRFLDARDERPQTAPERSSFLTETVNGQMHRRKPRKIAGVPQGAFLKSDLFLWLNLQPACFRLRGFDRAILAGVDRDLTRRPRERLLDDVNAGSLIVVVGLELLQRARSSATPPPKVEWHPGELYPRVGFIVTNLSRPAERVVVF